MVDCPSLAGLDRTKALALLEGLDAGRVSMALGWHSALAPLEAEDLAGFPPVIIANLSMHGFLLSPAALGRLAREQPRLAQVLADQAWVERHLPEVLERLDRDGARFPKVRMEHVQFIDERQVRRARDLGVMLSLQPNFNGESRDCADRLEPRWLDRNNPFRMLIDRVGFRNVLECAFNFASGNTIEVEDLPDRFREAAAVRPGPPELAAPGRGGLGEELSRFEKALIAARAKEARSLTGLADQLKISKQTLNYKLRKHGLNLFRT